MDQNGLYDIYGMIHVPWWQRATFWWVIGFGVFVFLCAAIYWLLRRFMSKKKNRLPADKALDALAQAYKGVIKNPQRSMKFYDQITAILKEYMIDRYQNNLVGCTDTEWINYLQINNEFPRELLPSFIEMIDRADQVKFAQGTALLELIGQDYNRAVRIIEQTKPVLKK